MDKDTRLEIKDRFFPPHNLLVKYHQARTSYKEQIASLKAQADTYNKIYIDAQVEEVNASLRATNQQTLEAFAEQAERLGQKLIEVTTRPITIEQASQLKPYIDLINSGVIDYKEAGQINAVFEGDQTALKMLQRAYQKSETLDGGVDKMLYPYDLERLEESLRNMGYSVFMQGNNVNDLGRTLAKVANWFGVKDYDWTIDAGELDANLRSSAGLPPSEGSED